MKKILILTEGQTEEQFVKQILGPYLFVSDIVIQPVITTTKRLRSGHTFKGGVISYDRVKKDVLKLLGDSSSNLVTTMIDFYGLPDDFPGFANLSGTTSIAKVQELESAFYADIGDGKFLPYFSLHEFEGLLFSSPDVIAGAFADKDVLVKLKQIRQAFDTPEKINDGPLTAPSKRLKALYPQYNKPFYGSLIAKRIGLQSIRTECRHFDEWLSRIETTA